MAAEDWDTNPDNNQRKPGIDLHEGQITSSIPSTCRALCSQIARYAEAFAPIEANGATEQINIPQRVPPGEYVITIPAANAASTKTAFFNYAGLRVETAIGRQSLKGSYIIRLPECRLIVAVKGEVDKGIIAFFIGSVPSGWQDITQDYSGRFIRGAPQAEAGELMASDVGSHRHLGRTTNTTAIYNFGERGHIQVDPNAILLKHTSGSETHFSGDDFRPTAHIHSGSIDVYDSAARSKPRSISLRLGVKL